MLSENAGKTQTPLADRWVCVFLAFSLSAAACGGWRRRDDL
jgi:hypothetical protein